MIQIVAGGQPRVTVPAESDSTATLWDLMNNGDVIEVQGSKSKARGKRYILCFFIFATILGSILSINYFIDCC